MKEFLIEGWDLILPVCGASSTLAQGATLAARWLHGPQPISNQSEGFGVFTPRGAVSTRGISVFVPGLWELWKLRKIPHPGMGSLSSAGVAGHRRWPEGQLSPHADFMSPNQSASSQWGWGFHAVWDGIDPGDFRFRPWVVGSCRDLGGLIISGWDLILPGCGGTRWPEGQLSPHASFMRPSQPGIRQWGVGISTSCGAVSTRGISAFVPGLSTLQSYGRISDPGMGNYPPRVRQDLDVGPRGNFRHALAPSAPANQQPVKWVVISTPCGAVST